MSDPVDQSGDEGVPADAVPADGSNDPTVGETSTSDPLASSTDAPSDVPVVDAPVFVNDPAAEAPATDQFGNPVPADAPPADAAPADAPPADAAPDSADVPADAAPPVDAPAADVPVDAPVAVGDPTADDTLADPVPVNAVPADTTSDPTPQPTAEEQTSAGDDTPSVPASPTGDFPVSGTEDSTDGSVAEPVVVDGTPADTTSDPTPQADADSQTSAGDDTPSVPASPSGDYPVAGTEDSSTDAVDPVVVPDAPVEAQTPQSPDQPEAGDQISGGDDTPAVPASNTGDYPTSGGVQNADNPPDAYIVPASDEDSTTAVDPAATSAGGDTAAPLQDDTVSQPQDDDLDTFAEQLDANSPDPEDLVNPGAPYNADNPLAAAVVYDPSRTAFQIYRDQLEANLAQAQADKEQGDVTLDVLKQRVEQRQHELDEFNQEHPAEEN